MSFSNSEPRPRSGSETVNAQLPDNRAAVWLTAARPKTLWAAAAPVIMGTAMAFDAGTHHWSTALAVLISAVLIQIGTNFHNDYADYATGADTDDRKGPLRVTQAGLVTPSTMKRATIYTFAAAVLAGSYLIWRGGWPIAAIGGLSIASAVWYSATSLSLARTGLADVFVLIFFGPIAVGGTYYVQALDIAPTVLTAGLAPGLLSVAILEVNNLRDVEEDKRARKRTLAVRFGASFARGLYVGALLGAYLMPVLLYFWTGAHAWTAAVILTLPLARRSIDTLFSYEHPRDLNDVLADTGKLLAVYSILFSIGWIL